MNDPDNDQPTLRSRGAAGPRKTLGAAVTVLVTLASLTLLAGPASAAATSTLYGCTVTPYAPPVYSDGAYAQGSTNVKCSSDMTVTVSQRLMEADTFPNPDDTVTGWKTTTKFIGAGRTVGYLSYAGACTNFDIPGSEELYQEAYMVIDGVRSYTAQSAQRSQNC